MSRMLWLVSVSLLVAAVEVGAQPACTDAVDFEEDGTIAQWDVCRGRALQTFVAPGERRLEVRVFAAGKPIDEGLTWRRDEKAHGALRFRAVDSVHRLEVLREYRRVDENMLEHTISVTNASDRALRDVALRLDVGGVLLSDHPASGSLADFFYGFHRTLFRDEGGEWHSSRPEGKVRSVALVSRHKTLVVDAQDAFALADSAVDLDLEPGSGGEQASRAASSPALLALDARKLEPGETIVLQQRIAALPTEARALAAAGYEGLTYAHLAGPIAWISKSIERVLAGLSALTGPGLAVILLALGVRVLTLPATLWSARRQSEFSAITARMKPEIARARASYQGAEQSEEILRIYKENGISPLSGLKGSVALFLQIPFLLAVFNVTTLSSTLYAEPFLWIEDLSLPDAAAALPASIMLLGDHVNVLPLAMGAIFLLAPPAGTSERMGLTWGPVLVTLLMVVLVYSFASALLLYWLAANAFQAGERLVFRRARVVPVSP